MSYELIVTLIVLVLFVAAMLSGKISFPLIGISGVAILVLSGAVTLQAGFSGFVDKNVIMLAGMFAMAAQFSRTSFIEKLKSKLLSGKASKNDTILMFTLLAFSAILAQFTNSQSSIIMLMMSFLISIGRDSEVTMSRVLLPMVLVMTAWMAKLPVGGGGLTTYLMLNQFIEAAGGAEFLDLFSMIKCCLIPCIIIIIWCCMTYKMLPKKELDASAYSSGGSGSETSTMGKRDEIITYIGFIFTVLSMVFQKQLGERAYMIPLAVMVVFIYLKVCSGKWFLQTLINGPVIMVATIMGIANALTASGAGDLIGNSILKLLGGNPSGYLICAVVTVVTTLLTSFISNTASFLMMCPIACSICVAAGIDCRAAVMMAFNCALISTLTPMASNGALIAYSTCGFSIRDTWKWTVPATIVSAVTLFIMTVLVYPPV